MFVIFQIFYFDRLKRLTFKNPRGFPLISVWDHNSINKRINLEHELGVCTVALVDRMDSPEVPYIQIPSIILPNEAQRLQNEEEQQPVQHPLPQQELEHQQN